MIELAEVVLESVTAPPVPPLPNTALAPAVQLPALVPSHHVVPESHTPPPSVTPAPDPLASHVRVCECAGPHANAASTSTASHGARRRLRAIGRALKSAAHLAQRNLRW